MSNALHRNELRVLSSGQHEVAITTRRKHHCCAKSITLPQLFMLRWILNETSDSRSSYGDYCDGYYS